MANREDVIQTAFMIDGLMTEEELGIIYDLAEKYATENTVVYETGTFKGRTSYVLAKAIVDKKARLVTIDSYGFGGEQRDEYIGHSLELAQHNLRECNNITYFQSKFVDFITQITDASFVFLDGDHNHHPLLLELCYFAAHSPVIAGHDWNDSRVSGAVNKFVAAFPSYKLETVDTKEGIYILTK